MLLQVCSGLFVGPVVRLAAPQAHQDALVRGQPHLGEEMQEEEEEEEEVQEEEEEKDEDEEEDEEEEEEEDEAVSYTHLTLPTRIRV